MGENQPSPFPGSSLGLHPEEASTIQTIPLNYGYNFAEPPYPKIEWTLLDLVSHSRFPMCRTDLCDKWNYREITAENFPLVVDPAQVSEPGILSARTVAKVISYCLLIAESTAESLPALSGKTNFFADDILEAIVERRRDFESRLGENSPWAHFLIAAHHPIVRWAVNNALMNRWGTKEYPAVG
ncbi:MAG TPA: hypothetical protein VF020_11835 [Chthoniobacterales bacterium]